MDAYRLAYRHPLVEVVLLRCTEPDELANYAR
jgi:hypothetical protein